MTNRVNLNFLFIAVLLLPGQTIKANVNTASVFSDNMVLQAELNITVWGTADKAESARIEIKGNGAVTRAGFDGKWQVKLPSMKFNEYAMPMPIIRFVPYIMERDFLFYLLTGKSNRTIKSELI